MKKRQISDPAKILVIAVEFSAVGMFYRSDKSIKWQYKRQDGEVT
jgi:hypothetical protein